MFAGYNLQIRMTLVSEPSDKLYYNP